MKVYTVRNLSPFSVPIPINPFPFLQTTNVTRFCVSSWRYFMYIQKKICRYTFFPLFYTNGSLFVHFLAYLFKAALNLDIF